MTLSGASIPPATGNKITKQPSSHVMRVLSISMFLIAFISFFVTAEGLNSFAFSETQYRGYIISFAITASLIVMHLKILTISFRKTNWENESGSVTAKIGQALSYVIKTSIWIIYLSLLFISIWFAYVYIVNFAYNNTRFIDTQAVGERVLVDEIVQAQEFINVRRDTVREEIQNTLVELQNNLVVPEFSVAEFPSIVDAISAPPTIEQPSESPIIVSDRATILRLLSDTERIVRDVNEIYSSLQNLSREPITDDTRRAFVTMNDRLNTVINELNEFSTRRTERETHLRNLPTVAPEWHAGGVNRARQVYLTFEIDLLGRLVIIQGSLETTRRVVQSTLTLTDQSLLVLFDATMNELSENAAGDTSADEFLNAVVDSFNNQAVGSNTSLQDFQDRWRIFLDLHRIFNELESHQRSISDIGYVPNSHSDAETADTWVKNWRELITGMRNTIHRIPLVTEPGEYNVTASINRLTMFYRNNFVGILDGEDILDGEGINAVERAWLYLVGADMPPRFNAVFSLVFAIFMDFSPLGMGMAIQVLISKKKNNTP